MRTSLFIFLALLFVIVSGTPSSFHRFCSHNGTHHGGHGHGHEHGHGGHHHEGGHHWGHHQGNWEHHQDEKAGQHEHEHESETEKQGTPMAVLRPADSGKFSPTGSSSSTPTSQHKTHHEEHDKKHKHNPHCYVPDLVIGKGKLVISNPQLFPLVVMGIFIGLVLLLLTTKTIQLPHGAPISYASIFFFFTIMNVSALLYFCMLPSANSTSASLIAMFSEGFATSSIGLSLFVAALTDAGVARDCSLFKLAFTIIGYLVILYGCIQSFFFQLFFPHGIRMLFFGLPIAGFVCYYLVQTVRVFHSQNRSGAAYLVLSFLAFGAAFSAEIVNIHNCHLLPTYFNGEMIWFFCLNLSFFFIFKYYVTRGMSANNPPAYSEITEDPKVVDAESGTIEALYPQSSIQTKQ